MGLTVKTPVPLSAAAHTVPLSRAAAKRLAVLVDVWPRIPGRVPASPPDRSPVAIHPAPDGVDPAMPVLGNRRRTEALAAVPDATASTLNGDHCSMPLRSDARNRPAAPEPRPSAAAGLSPTWTPEPDRTEGSTRE
ncbi:hypothetical protein EV192_10145 [Actinocrispum wychmicini]|uniref:Uncharacterized protein n=1 Tax=Actinocrispum wychmicini TaxID=1213861 RepID=A0A4V2S8K6_9PSEU|nr:hypothetical protein EV192_10145 [Actinocrispum wychmicini]